MSFDVRRSADTPQARDRSRQALHIATTFCFGDKRSSDSASRTSESRFDLTIVYIVSQLVATNTIPV